MVFPWTGSWIGVMDTSPFLRDRQMVVNNHQLVDAVTLILALVLSLPWCPFRDLVLGQE